MKTIINEPNVDRLRDLIRIREAEQAKGFTEVGAMARDLNSIHCLLQELGNENLPDGEELDWMICRVEDTREFLLKLDEGVYTI